jgi:hypothetical protein
MNIEIYVPIVCSPSVEFDDIRELCAGLEEEGVPYKYQHLQQELDAIEFGQKAAMESSLQIGIGVDRNFNASLCHQSLPGNKQYITCSSGHLREFGSNSGRLVKGLPLILSKEDKND